jgi:hypothetical protein
MTATAIAVVYPTWDMRRALTRCAEMMALERRHRAEYVIVVPRAENLRIGEWVNGLDPEDAAIHIIETREYLSPVEAMAEAGRYLLSNPVGDGTSGSSIFMFLHDDTTILERAWDEHVIDFFTSHPRCGLAGFGGGVGFATDDIYRTAYDHRQLARLDFVSNMRDAHHHGRRVTEACRVAALDGFALVTTRDFYEHAGQRSERAFQKNQVWNAWESCLIDGIPYHMYDAWISCRATELGYETWMIPVSCHHEGGQTSVKREDQYAKVVERLGYRDPQHLYDAAHLRIYSRFAGVLPIRVPRVPRVVEDNR